VVTDFGGNREARRDRQADVGHLGQVRPFAAEQVAHGGVPLAEEVNTLLGWHGLRHSLTGVGGGGRGRTQSDGIVEWLVEEGGSTAMRGSARPTRIHARGDS